MTKDASTQHGEPLSQESKKLVNEVRLRLTQPIHPNDEMEDVPFSKNPIFTNRFLPQGEIRPETDSQGRALWFVEYATITIEGIAHSIRSSAAIRYQFW
uniref:Uncharacterized protein n=1 Tax=Panagrolaimus sp. ES5 TaxID=591445 RepID=A0AC34GD18_9BILA